MLPLPDDATALLDSFTIPLRMRAFVPLGISRSNTFECHKHPEVGNTKTPITKRIVAAIAAIVKVIRFPGWQQIIGGAGCQARRGLPHTEVPTASGVRPVRQGVCV